MISSTTRSTISQSIIWLIIASVIVAVAVADGNLVEKRKAHRALNIQDSNEVLRIGNQFDAESFKYYLNGIMIPRVPGTPGHQQVKTFIIDELQKLSWTVTTDKFTARVPAPFKKLPFESIIATPNPNAERYLIYAAHYDSKYFANDPNFVAATDSAVACAMMLTIAKGLQNHLDLRTQRGNDLSILLVFFDGEEAIQNWSATDSIYGARHLAKRWEQANFLPKIDMMVLLDLIGAPDPKFYNFHQDTQQWYSKLVDAEQKLGEAGQLSHLWQRPHTYLQPNTVHSYIEDDHIPFLRRGVPIVHLITMPFPEVWHTSNDNANAIDYHSTYDLMKIFGLFVAEYLHLTP